MFYEHKLRSFQRTWGATAGGLDLRSADPFEAPRKQSNIIPNPDGAEDRHFTAVVSAGYGSLEGLIRFQ